MFGLTKLSAAVANLAASLNAMASVVDVATGRLRQQLSLDYTTNPLEHTAHDVPVDELASLDPANPSASTAPDANPPTNGRSKPRRATPAA
jgi:hypothetical protein